MGKKRTVASTEKQPTSESATGAPAQTTIVFDGSLDIAAADMLREQLMQALTGHQPVVLDAVNVGRVDTAALQVLTAFIKDAGAQNLDVQWKEPTQALRNAAHLLGLHDSLLLHC
jgi:ABC-type transporter Mla MlaB component